MKEQVLAIHHRKVSFPLQFDLQFPVNRYFPTKNVSVLNKDKRFKSIFWVHLYFVVWQTKQDKEEKV